MLNKGNVLKSIFMGIMFAKELLWDDPFYLEPISSPREKRGFAGTGAAGLSFKPQAYGWLSRI